MALKILSAAEAMKMVKGADLPCDKGRDMPDDITAVMKASKTAATIFEYVKSHQETITLCFFECPYKAAYGEVFINGAVFDDQAKTVWFNLSVDVFNADAKTAGTLVVPPSLVFFHEFGHAKQWLENNAQYQAWSEEGFGGLGFNKRIEDDNLLRHEWPICDEMVPAFPRRTNYPRWCGFNQEVEKLKASLPK
jgi:hypothetical protein